jgi:hypothetical protein
MFAGTMIARVLLLLVAMALAYFGFNRFHGAADYSAFIAAVFGVVASSLFVLFLESWRRPNIVIEIERVLPPRHNGRQFLRVGVRNENTPFLIKFFLDRQPALLTSARIVFLTEQGHLVFNRDEIMQGRWASTPEPVSIQLLPNPQVPGAVAMAQVLDPSRIRDAVDIAPGAEEMLDVVMRSDIEEACIGWHNGGILGSTPPKYMLGKGRYHALIVVQVGGRLFRKVVRIVNDLDIDHFRLEDADDTTPQLPAGHPLRLKA